MEDHFNAFQLLIAQFRAGRGIMSETSVAIALLRALHESDQYKSIAKSIRLTSNLATICVEDIEAKFVVEAHDHEEKFVDAVNPRARELHPPYPICGKSPSATEADLCVLCLDPIDGPKKSLFELGCRHQYHRVCFYNLLKDGRYRSCPLRQTRSLKSIKSHSFGSRIKKPHPS